MWDRSNLSRSFRQDPLIESILHALLNELKVPEPGSRLYIESPTNQLAVRLIRRCTQRMSV